MYFVINKGIVPQSQKSHRSYTVLQITGVFHLPDPALNVMGRSWPSPSSWPSSLHAVPLLRVRSSSSLASYLAEGGFCSVSSESHRQARVQDSSTRLGTVLAPLDLTPLPFPRAGWGTKLIETSPGPAPGGL